MKAALSKLYKHAFNNKTMTTINQQKTITSIKHWTVFFMVALALSGITAIPVQQELKWILNFAAFLPSGLFAFIQFTYNGLELASETLPQLFYGYDWLAFAHIIIAIFFIGVYQKPVCNIWIVEAGIIACLLIFPFTFVCGTFRGIPFWWQLVDCSFGAVGLVPLLVIHRKIKSLQDI